MEEYKRLMEPYTGSFNFFLNEGLKLIVKHLEPTFYESEGSKVSIKFDEIQIGNPMSYKTLNHRMYPTDARQSHSSYASPMHGWLLVTYGEREPERIQVNLGTIPMMVGSSKCNLYNATPKELIAHHEEEWEVGGFFIVNGVERCLRMVQVARAGHPFAFIRESYTRKMTGYSEFACQVRCVRPDKETKINTLHYVTDGNITLRFMLRGKEFYIPVGLLLKGFYDCTDRQIYETMIQGDYENTFLTDRVELMLAANRDYSVTTRKQALHRLGKLFTRETVFPFADPDMTTEERGEYLIRNYIFPHLDAGQDKFELLVFMIQKLLALVSGRIVADNVDAPSAHEILTPGNLFMVLLKERLRVWMHSIIIGIRIRLSKPKSGKFDDKMLRTCIHDKASTVGQALNYFVATGNIKMEEAFEAPQTSGFSIVAERLNKLRYMAHFRAVHRGAFFAEMKTTTPRKLRPESWGFYCCVHTPDGAPCGLLNHLTALCNVVKEQQLLPARLESLLNTMGMASIGQGSIFPPRYLVVMVNGRVYGRVAPELADSLVKSLRVLKLDQSDPAVPSTLEVVYVPPSITTLYPGIFIYTASARVIRPVLHLASGKTELIGIMEQQFLDIAATDVDIRPETTHKELHPTNILSVVASLTPFSEFNQSPRNMYQCQMGKQSMGTPYHAHPYRTDNKVFKIQHPQKALVRTHAQDKYNMDDYPNGCNAVVAVITYTGYDMEDAMIINKSSYERGFGHGTVYSTKFYDITPTVTKDTHRCYFKKHPTASPDYIDENGLPEVGTKLEKDDVFLQYVTEPQMDFNKEKHKSREPAYIDRVTVIGGTDESEKNRVQHVSVRLRYNRNPIVGDKFSSRHGQKGVLSKLWPEIDMPFSESGMKPDCIINPHAFPSRMTIGMLIESMAGKSGALHGYFPDATPFQFDEKNTAVECFGETLAKAGFNYYGNEPMYSGTTGEIFHADIYLGLVYYQRLRHMVNDKYQARATGQVNRVTQQPIKGRKVGGGIRFGEMERDSLIAHGTSALLLDRLMECSDYSRTYACKNCGSIVSTKSQTDDNGNNVVKCATCDSAEDIAVIALPFIYRVLTNELAAVNIKISLEIK